MVYVIEKSIKSTDIFRRCQIPIYEYRIHNSDGTPTNNIIEHICKMSDKPQRLVAEDGRYALPIISVVAKTPGGWHGNWSAGMSHTMFSKALGRNVANVWEEAKEMNRRGFVNETDLGKDFVANTQMKLSNQWDAQEKLTQEFQNACKTMSKEDAIVNTFTAEKCLSGELDNIYKQPLKEN